VELWAAATRAVRTPNWAERHLNAPISTSFTPSGLPNYITALGNDRIGPEVLLAYEGGARLQVGSALALDLAVFCNHYSGLQSLEAGTPGFNDPVQPTAVVTPFEFANGLDATSRGLEVAAQWQPVRSWKLAATYTAFGIQAFPDLGPEDFISMERIDSVPRHQNSAVSSFDLPGRIEWTTTWTHSGERKFLQLPGFHRLDSNILWRATSSVDLGFGFRNLTGQQVIQYDSIRGLGVLPEFDPGRRVFVRAAFRF
jgi:outer membrane receptor protein involved in Fe transport